MRIQTFLCTLAPDFFVCTGFFTIIAGGCSMYIPYVVNTHILDASSGIFARVWCFYLPILLAFLADLFLLLTVVGDPGIITVDHGPTSQDTMEHAELANTVTDTHYCPVCKVHVEMFDHHCGLIGACIGRYTYLTFNLFLAFAAALCLTQAPLIAYVVVDTVFVHIIAAGEPLSVHGILSGNVIVPVGLLVASVMGGAYCGFLSLHYFVFAYQGRHSLEKRRRWQEIHRDELDISERRGMTPLSGYWRHSGNVMNLRALASDFRRWRRAR